MDYIYDASRKVKKCPRSMEITEMEFNGTHSIVLDDNDQFWMTVPVKNQLFLYPMQAYEYEQEE